MTYNYCDMGKKDFAYVKRGKKRQKSTSFQKIKMSTKNLQKYIFETFLDNVYEILKKI